MEVSNEQSEHPTDFKCNSCGANQESSATQAICRSIRVRIYCPGRKSSAQGRKWGALRSGVRFYEDRKSTYILERGCRWTDHWEDSHAHQEAPMREALTQSRASRAPPRIATAPRI